MATTIVDALVVTLGLDLSGFKKGKQEAAKVTSEMTKEQIKALKASETAAKKAAKEQEEANKRAKESFTKLRNEVLALAAIFTGGMGIKNFIEETIGSAANLGFMSKNLQMSTTDLAAWQNAARRAGSSAEGITAALSASQQEVAKFKIGQVTEGVQQFFRWGGSVNDLKDGNTYLLARARIVQNMYRTDPGRARLVAQQMGVSESEFNFIRQGPAAILSLVDAQKKNAAVTDAMAQKAQELRNKWFDLTDRFKYTGTVVLLDLMPVLEQLADKLMKAAEYAADHKEDIVEWAKAAVTAIEDLVRWADKASESVGGWKNVLIGLAALKVLSMASDLMKLAAGFKAIAEGIGLAKTASAGGGLLWNLLSKIGVKGAGLGAALMLYSPDLNEGEDEYIANRREPIGATASDRGKYLMQVLQNEGFTRAQAAGSVGSLLQENGQLDPNAKNPNSSAYGIGQWTKSRQGDFAKLFKKQIQDSTFEEQVRFMVWELRNSEKAAADAIKATKTVDEAAVAHRKRYERPAEDEAHDEKRIAYARQLYESSARADAGSIGANASQAAAGTVNNSTQTSTQTNSTHFHGPINIHTQATDAAGIAGAFGGEVRKYAFTMPQANTGVTP
ncbi:phage tail tip lysozyme [Pandoraea terrigena]|uniref:Phage tail lysozyme domain-containing protein n=1 Tax=Pandoraea terrigena TaxID=2508292 RepID=A0A5E4V5H5_9BURK|nr:phage tail tip lysozyme [Pandoraea terrigena]VVE07562.1 hypothetical protein PTE31013_02470 [Pandoraea terrigena]